LKLRKADYYDYNLVAVILLLVGFGLVMLYSTSAYTAEITQGNDMYFFRRQAIISVGAIAAALAISLVDYHILAKFSIPLYSAAAILMLMVHFFGITHNGAKRWLKIGIEFQPAEIAKIAVIVAVPAIIVWQKEWFNSFSGTCLPIGAGGLLALFAYVFTDNLSTAVIIFAIACVIVFVAHPKTVPFLIIVAVGAVLVGILVFFLWRLDSSGGHFRLQRILVWQNPEKYIASGGYQIMQALYAIGSGGVFGKGLGNSAQKLGWLPEAQNDMIFPIICEELGIFGGAIVIVLFIFMLYRLMFIAQNAPDKFGALMVTGIFAHLALQVVLNICVVLNLIPTTGVTLPFISYGGTSVLFLMMEMAIALSVSRMIKFRRQEKDLWGDSVHTGRYK
jgi:cell division protein FtsW